MRVDGSVALITGGASGIGETCAREMAKAGAKIVLCDLDQLNLERVVAEIRSAGGDAVGVRGNVANEEDQAQFVKSALDTFGQLNIVLTAAGTIRDGTLVTTDKETGKVVSKMSLANWQRVIDANLTGTFLTVRDSVEAMVNGGWPGVIILISSINKEGQVGQLNYCSTKAAVALMPKILVGEFIMRRISGIRVVAIAPGYVDTPILQSMNQDVLRAIMGDVHLGRLIDPCEIARLAIHCVENDAINATTLEIAGGVSYHRSRAK